jgi:tripartite-type tricarboxylate transporter receptor subunit TctC
MDRRQFIRLSSGAAAFGMTGSLLAVSTATDTLAQAWPAKPITVVVPFTPGTAVDISARVVMDEMSRQVGQPVVVENRGGAGSTIGTNIVAKAPPDGHTILVSGSMASAHAMFNNLPYDTLRDFTGVISLGLQPLVLVTAPSKGFKTLDDLIKAAKAGSLTYASAGIGSATHLALERFRLSAGFEAQHVPFRGAPEGLREVIAGRVDFYSVPLPPALPLIKDGKLVALAVSADKRATVLPDVPTTVELGHKGSAYYLYGGVYVHSKTPAATVQRLHEEIKKALAVPAVVQRMRQIGAEPMPMSQPEFDKYFRDDVAANVQLANDAKIPKQ